MNAPQTLSRWSRPGSSRVPFWVYTGDFKLSSVGERQVIMVRDRKKLGSYSKFDAARGVASSGPADGRSAKLESDPNVLDHGISVVENRCAHRGVRLIAFPQPAARV